jgi:hypothetical protein
MIPVSTERPSDGRIGIDHIGAAPGPPCIQAVPAFPPAERLGSRGTP